MEVGGKGRKGILVVGEAPGKNEDYQNKPFVGESGQMVQAALARCGIDFRRDCWITNSIICRPAKNALPEKAIDYCRPNLIRTIKELKPKVIILLGAASVKSLIGWLWKEDVGSLHRWLGWKIPVQRINAYVCPTWHPQALMYASGKGNGGKASPLMQMLWEGHLHAACALTERPWKEMPNYASKVIVELDHQRAASRIQKLISHSAAQIAIDYETTCLKPDGKDAQIYSCALSNGRETIAFPWHGDAIEATKQIILSNAPKIASNQKFEERWTLKEFGHPVNNWLIDTMLAAHVLDNRSGITSIKFQAFALLGAESWNDEIDPYLKSIGGGNSVNKIRQAPLNKLLLYNGLDALLEWEVAQIQMKQLGMRS